MSSEGDITIRVQSLSKCFQIYDTPRDRLKQFVIPRLFKIFSGPLKFFSPRNNQFPPPLFYREFWALKDASFEIKRGETVGIIGRNGSGKSTLLQMICGTLYPTKGDIQTKGRIAALLELGSGFNPEFTGRENIYLNGTILGLDKEEIEARLDDIITFADIGDFIDQPVKTYSSGMFVRLAFAIQAHIDPEILIIDEALAVGDAYFVHKCMLRFNQLKEAGVTILFVSHDATAIKTLCSRAIWIDGGEVVSVGAASQVVDQYLSAISKQSEVAGFSRGQYRKVEEATRNEAGAWAVEENEIPNIDKRFGDQSCVFVGLGLYNEAMQRAIMVNNDSIIILRATIENNNLEKGTLLILGCILRNHRGIDIASNNSEIEKVAIVAPEKGQRKTVRMRIHLPALHPGSYSFNISLGCRLEGGEIRDIDSITNGVVFNIVSQKSVHVLMALQTEFEDEGYGA